MQRPVLRLCLAACVCLASIGAPLLSAAGAAERTTTPGQVYVINVTLTDKAIVIPKDRFSKGHRYPRYPRGAAIQYRFKNATTHLTKVRMWDRTTPVIRPGQVEPLLINWNFRGRYRYETLGGGGKKLGPFGIVTIF
jgi:hypothetical protein